MKRRDERLAVGILMLMGWLALALLNIFILADGWSPTMSVAAITICVVLGAAELVDKGLF